MKLSSYIIRTLIANGIKYAQSPANPKVEMLVRLCAEAKGTLGGYSNDWDQETTFVSAYGDAEAGECCDVEVMVGECDGIWYLRTQDDAGGSDDADATPYLTEADARSAAKDWAETEDDSDGESAEAYTERL